MEQKNIWMRFLIIGGLISISLLLNSCTKDYEQTAEFVIINNTDCKISFDERLKGYNLLPKQLYKSIEVMYGNKNINENSYRSPLYMAGPITIAFNNNKCLVLQTIDSEHSILNIKNFVAEKNGSRSYKFTYIFTEADYNRATTCP